MLLSKGLNFGIYPLYLNLIEVQKEFENLYQEIRSILDHIQRTEFKRFCLICTTNTSSDDWWQKVLSFQLQIYCVVYFRT